MKKEYQSLLKDNDRPQNKFKVPVDNSADSVFKPKLQKKPNALRPLHLIQRDGNYEHPYKFELESFRHSDGYKQLQPPRPLKETPLEYVRNVRELQKLFEELRTVTEIAIDLENSHMSFQGFTCLLQISTRQKDYIIDTLELREELQILNEIFTDPWITKVMHCADRDIEWMQRDFSLYVVNMFDTQKAGRVLGFTKLGLESIAEHFQIILDKSCQTDDWRIRPLPKNMMNYARNDTHYLLYIYDCMRNELLNSDPKLLDGVYEKSKDICLTVYQKPGIIDDKTIKSFSKGKQFNERQFFALCAILHWRDMVARNEDYHPTCILHNVRVTYISEQLWLHPSLGARHSPVLQEIVSHASDETRPLSSLSTHPDAIKALIKSFYQRYNSNNYMYQNRDAVVLESNGPIYYPPKASRAAIRVEEEPPSNTEAVFSCLFLVGIAVFFYYFRSPIMGGGKVLFNTILGVFESITS